MKTNNSISFENAGTKLPFTVPENYFEDFATQFDRTIGVKPAPKLMFRTWMYAAAAVIVGFALLTPLMYHNAPHSSATPTDNYESYVLSQVDENVVIDSYADDQNTK